MSRFDMEGQLVFAALSGDWNPIHVDPIAARRFMFGQPVVHGVHTLLWLLDHWLAGMPPLRITRLRADFRNPLRLGIEVIPSITISEPGKVLLEAAAAGVKVIRVEVEWGSGHETQTIPNAPPTREPVHDLPVRLITSATGSVPLHYDRAQATILFPHAATKLPPDQFACLLASTRIVGMRVPGLHSLLNGIELEAAAGESPALAYAVEHFDARFSRVSINVRGAGFSGTLTASCRPAPTAQATYPDIARAVVPGEFAGQRALVIGGSRGLGEIAVKQLAAGGAQVHFSYHLGESDAKRVAAEITDGGGIAECFHLDVRGDLSNLDTICRNAPPTTLAFFSTPPIAGAPKGKFDAAIFHHLCQVYVDAFMNIYSIAQAAGALASAMQPSSIAIDEVPFGMSEYAAAKAAADVMMTALKKAHPRIRFHSPRWGRMPTDLTATVTAVDVDDPLPIVLAALRSTCGTSSGNN